MWKTTGRTACVALVLMGCVSPIRVDWESDPNLSLSSCRTYAWLPISSEVPARWREAVSQLTPVIQSTVDESLADRALQRDADTPDIWLRGEILVERQVTRTTLDSFGDPRLGGRPGSPVEHEFTFDEGSIVIDVLPRDRSAVAWRGWARAEVVPDRDPADRRGRVESAVRRILSQFPCSPAS